MPFRRSWARFDGEIPMPHVVRLAHLSDLHVALPLAGPHPGLKRWLGRLNWLANRRWSHDPARLAAAVEQIVRARPDAVLVTGDLGQTGQPEEIQRAAAALAPLAAAGIPALVVSGNHDRYGAEPEAQQAFRRVQEALRLHLEPDAAGVVRLGAFEIILLEQGRPTPVLAAWGEVGEGPLEALATRLGAENTASLVRIAAGHYPLVLPGGRPLPRRGALRDADALKTLFHASGVQAYLCGHMHQAYTIAVGEGCVQYCAGSITGRHGRVRWFVCADGMLREEE